MGLTPGTWLRHERRGGPLARAERWRQGTPLPRQATAEGPVWRSWRRPAPGGTGHPQRRPIVSQTIGRPLVMQLGHERGTAFMVKHPGELEEQTRIERTSSPAGSPSGLASAYCRAGATRTASSFSSRETRSRCSSSARSSVRGPFRIALTINNSHKAKLASARFQPRDPTVADLIRYLARANGAPATDWLIADELLMEPRDDLEGTRMARPARDRHRGRPQEQPGLCADARRPGGRGPEPRASARHPRPPARRSRQ